MTPELDRREFLMLTAAAAAFAQAPQAFARAAGDSATAAGWAGYGKAIVIDALGGPGNVNRASDEAPLDAAELAGVRACGLTAVNITLGSVGVLANAFEETVKSIAYWDREIDAHPEALLKVKSAADLKAAKSSGRLGLIYGFQDTLSLGDDVGRLDTFSRLGVRIIQLTYNRRNLLGDGCLEAGNAGLSGLGRRVVERMNELGILVDLSHCGQRTTAEGIEASKKPVAITHSGCAALADLPRNKPDAILRQLADKGGVVGIYLMPFLRGKGQPMAEDLIRHIDHAVQVCGDLGRGAHARVSAQVPRGHRQPPAARHFRAGGERGGLPVPARPEHPSAPRYPRVAALQARVLGRAGGEDPGRKLRPAVCGGLALSAGEAEPPARLALRLSREQSG
jgi:membrane dipeptidase